MKKYLIVVEKTGTGYSSYSPDLDGCVATGRSREEVKHEMREAMAFHLEGPGAERRPHTRTANVFHIRRGSRSRLVAASQLLGRID